MRVVALVTAGYHPELGITITAGATYDIPADYYNPELFRPVTTKKEKEHGRL